ncbi:MAG TPA: hypothetical protein VGV13_00950 [Methylomirabilota bacterium]|jgi:hypothetical protein|nr:hypothetical protein [Methylomirabilota bacterium]
MGPTILVTPTADPDGIASHLAQLAANGLAMPRGMWDRARISVPACGPGGEYFGRLIPGRGFYLAMDLESLGITRRIPGVFEQSPMRRVMDALLDERGLITSQDGINAARGSGLSQDVALSKATITTVANTYSSLYRAGGLPVAGTFTNIPGGAAHNKNSTGAWSFGLSNPVSPNRKYLVRLGFTHAQIVNQIILVDLLVAAGNIDTNISTTQAISSVPLTRYASGAGVLMTFEVTTALGATASTLTVTKYTNQAGMTLRATPAVAMTTSAIVQRLQPAALGPFMELQAGDYGVRSVEDVQLSAAMLAGVIALNLYFPLAFIPGIAANVAIREPFDDLRELITETGQVVGCLTGYVFANTTTTGLGTYSLRTVEG